MRILCHHFLEQCFKARRNVRSRLTKHRNRAVAVGEHLSHGTFHWVRYLTGKDGEQRAAQAVDIRSAINVVAIGELLRSHEIDRSQGYVRARQMVFGAGFPASFASLGGPSAKASGPHNARITGAS